MRRSQRITLALGFLALGPRGALAQAAPSATPPAVQVRVVAGVGAMYIHRPSFEYTRGTSAPRTFTEQETDGGGVAFGGGLEAITARWWGGIGAQVLLPVFDEGTSIVTSAHGGPILPRLLGGRVRIGAGPVLVRSTRRERGLFGGLCFTDCTPVRYPPPLMTAGLGVVLITEWTPWTGVGIGLEGQLATGAQRFASGRLRVSLGS